MGGADGGGPAPGDSLAAAVAAVDALRERDAWNAAQTHASLARYALEEGHEVAAAAEAVGSPDAGGLRAPGALLALRDELGDLLLQVLLHARLASEHPGGSGRPSGGDGSFDLADVAASLVAKAHRRHPHVFPGPSGPAGAPGPTVAELEAGWEALKDVERAGRDPLDDLPATLPALVRAQKVLALAERRGVPTPARPPAGASSRTTDADEIGDALLALTSRARHAGLDAEQELRASVRALEDAVRAAPGPSRR